MRFNKNYTTAIFFAVLGSIITSNIAFTNNNGKAGFTGSPGENNCTNCHNTNPVNSGGGSVTISSPDLTNWTYNPGQTYTINVTVRKTGSGKFGFGFESLLSSGANAGLINASSSINAKTVAATVAGNSRTNAVHKQPNHFGTDSVVFSFNWTAPNAGTGNIAFYAAGNATNSSNSSSGDFIYTTTRTVNESVSTGLIGDNKHDLQVQIFPQPANNMLHIIPSKASTGKKPLVFTLSNMAGQEVYRTTLQTQHSGEFNVELPELENGVYLYQLLNESGGKAGKILVSR